MENEHTEWVRDQLKDLSDFEVVLWARFMVSLVPVPLNIPKTREEAIRLFAGYRSRAREVFARGGRN